MKITIPNDTARNQKWAYGNGINFYPVDILEMIYFNGCKTTDEKFPLDIELEVSFYDDEIDLITYNDPKMVGMENNGDDMNSWKDPVILGALAGSGEFDIQIRGTT